MNLDRFNLNLLVALDTLLHSQSLTDAAEKVNLTQSAMSMALKRLREHFNDELVIYSSGQQQFTPLATALMPRVRDAVLACRETIKLRKTFDPVEANDSFRIATTDLSELPFLNGLVVEMVRSAPHISVTTIPFRFEPMERYFAEGTDVILVPSNYTSDRFASALVMRMEFVCISSIDNPALADGLTEEKLFSLPHVSVSLSMPTGPHPTTVALQTFFERVPISVRVNSCSSLPQIVMGTELIAIVPRPFAQQWNAVAGIKIFKMPVEVPPIDIVAQWQLARTREPAIAWFLNKLHAHAVKLESEARTISPEDGRF
jgi:LysR family nod box-dependent transcriptional activator